MDKTLKGVTGSMSTKWIKMFGIIMMKSNIIYVEGDIVEVKYSDKLWYEAKISKIADTVFTVTFTDESWDGGPYNTVKENIRYKGLFSQSYPHIQVFLDDNYINGILYDEEGEGLWTVQLGSEEEDDVEFLCHIPESHLQYSQKVRNQIHADNTREEKESAQQFLNFALEQVELDGSDNTTMKRIDSNDPRLEGLNHCKFSDHAADRAAQRVEHTVEALRGVRYNATRLWDILIHTYISTHILYVNCLGLLLTENVLNHFKTTESLFT
jgi:hypothetical protein